MPKKIVWISSSFFPPFYFLMVAVETGQGTPATANPAEEDDDSQIEFFVAKIEYAAKHYKEFGFNDR